MKKNAHLVIVESPTKTKSLSKYLGTDYVVLSSKGHIIDLPKSQLGVDVENNFTPQYQALHGKGAVIKDLAKAAKSADIIYLATDLDREGEAISWHIASALGALDTNGKLSAANSNKFKRVIFHEITKDAILEAFNQPRILDYNLIDAYQARRVLDRLVGYKLSPLLWKKIQYGLSAGRVQSVALRLLVEREHERERFTSKPFYRLQIISAKDNNELIAELTHINNVAIETKHTINLFAGDYTYSETTVNTQEKKNEIANELSALGKVLVDSVITRNNSKSAPAPFTTATLQRTATTKINTSPKQTMMLAQQLYEEGFITYHRTDSTSLSQQFIDNARSYIKAEHGDAYLPQSANVFKTNQKNAQEAHEAIRPTSTDLLSIQKAKIRSTFDERAADLFELIYKRSISSQMTPALYENTTIKFISADSSSNSYQFSASGSILVFDGYMKEWGRGNGDTDLPKVEKGETLAISRVESTEHTTTPPPRYNEASLIKALEENGIGRPSTYAPTIDTIQYRNYAYKENSALVPSDTGIAVSHLLTDHFEEIVDLGFTADMENKFDDIANGQAQWQTVIRDFYTPFEKKIEIKDEELERKDYKIIKELDEKCPDCEHNLVLKIGKYGKFYSCSNFPECKYAKPFVEKIDMQCPTCQIGDVIVRRTRFGKVFYGCSNYPDCDWASWTDPRSEGYDPEVEREKQEQRKARAASRDAKKPVVKKAKKAKVTKSKPRKANKADSKRKS